MGMDTGKSTILPNLQPAYTYLYNMINNLFIWNVKLINLFIYLFKPKPKNYLI